MKSAYDKISRGIADMKAYKSGDVSRGRIAKPSPAAEAKAAARISAKAVRAKVGLSQQKFADAFRLPVATLRDWENERRSPDTTSATYLRMIDADPKGVRAILAKVADP